MSTPHDLAAAYAFDALEGLQRFTFEAHLEHCEQCLRDVSDVRDASELLSVGITLTPPTALREQVMARTEELPARAECSPVAQQSRVRRWLGRG